MKQIDLRTIAKYKDIVSVSEALLDDDFSNAFLRRIVRVLQIPSAETRRKGLSILQTNASRQDIKRVEWALDDKGYMYDFMNIVVSKELYHENERTHEAEKQIPSPMKRKSPIELFRMFLFPKDRYK